MPRFRDLLRWTLLAFAGVALLGVLALAFLLVRPQGLFGERIIERV